MSSVLNFLVLEGGRRAFAEASPNALFWGNVEAGIVKGRFRGCEDRQEVKYGREEKLAGEV